MKKLIALLLVVACGGSAATTAPDPNAAVLGSYALTTYNGASLPTDGIVSGSMALFADHYEFAYSGAGQPNAYTERGTWRLNATALVLTDETAVNNNTVIWSGSIQATTISMDRDAKVPLLHPAMTFTR